MKRPPTEWEKIFANNKGLISKIYKNSYNSSKKQPDLKNGQRILIDIFPKKAYRWTTGT